MEEIAKVRDSVLLTFINHLNLVISGLLFSSLPPLPNRVVRNIQILLANFEARILKLEGNFSKMRQKKMSPEDVSGFHFDHNF